MSPSPGSILGDARHWRARAEEARTVADQMTDPIAKASMLRLAEEYDKLAEHARQRAADKDG